MYWNHLNTLSTSVLNQANFSLSKDVDTVTSPKPSLALLFDFSLSKFISPSSSAKSMDLLGV